MPPVARLVVAAWAAARHTTAVACRPLAPPLPPLPLALRQWAGMATRPKRGAAAAPAAAAASAAAPAAAAADGTLPFDREARAYERYAAGGQRGVVVVGVDEAGRGPLAGPVVAAAAVVLDGAHRSLPPVAGVRDSKKVVDEAEREALFAALSACPAIVAGVGIVDHATIDRINILQGAMLAMELAVEDLRLRLAGTPHASAPMHVLVDGPRLPAGIEAVASGATGAAAADAASRLGCVRGAEAIIGGDSKVYSIAAASIVAKVTRDRIMHELDRVHPGYGFAVHKGYPTAAHVAAVHKLGPSPVHRMTFGPLKAYAATGAPAAGESAAKRAPSRPPAAAAAATAAAAAAAPSARAARAAARAAAAPPPPPPVAGTKRKRT